MHSQYQNKIMIIISSFLMLFSSQLFAENRHFPINVEVTELQEFDGVRNNSLLEKTLIRPRFLVKHKRNHHRHGFKVKKLYLCESSSKCDSINLSISKSKREAGQKVFPYFVGQPKKYHSIWVEYRTNKHKKKFKKLRIKSAVDFSNAYSYEMFFDSRGHKGHSVKYLASGGVAASDGVIALYQPKKGIKNLKVGSFKISIPRRAARKPFVIGFNVLEKENDPRKKLNIEITNIDSNLLSKNIVIKTDLAILPPNKTFEDYEFKYGSQYVEPKQLKSGKLKYISKRLENSFEIRELSPLKAMLKTQSKLDSIGKETNRLLSRTAARVAHPTDGCIAALNAQRIGIDNLISQGNHNVYSDACENLYPNVWATITDLSSLPDIEIAYPWTTPWQPILIDEVRQDGTFPTNLVLNSYFLQTISNLASLTGAEITVNGGVWFGDEARFYDPGPIGAFMGVVHDRNDRIKGFLKYNNRAFIGFRNNLYSGNSFNAQMFVASQNELSEDLDSDTFNYEGYNYVTVPTHETIVLNGHCQSTASNPGKANLLSAMGITNDNRLIILSSSSIQGTWSNPFPSKITTPYDLCLVFQSFGVTDAIMLDGGSSASLNIGGRHVNPLYGINSIATGGSERKILYGISLH